MRKVKMIAMLLMTLMTLTLLTGCDIPDDIVAEIKTALNSRADMNVNAAKELYNSGLITEQTYNTIAENINNNVRKMAEGLTKEETAKNMLKAVVDWRIISNCDSTNPHVLVNGVSKPKYTDDEFNSMIPTNAIAYKAGINGEPIRRSLGVNNNNASIKPIIAVDNDAVANINETLGLPICVLNTNFDNKGLDEIIEAVAQATESKNQAVLDQYFSPVYKTDANGASVPVTLIDTSKPENQVVVMSSGSPRVNDDNVVVKEVDAYYGEANADNKHDCNGSVSPMDYEGENRLGKDMIINSSYLGYPVMAVRLQEFNQDAIDLVKEKVGMSQDRYFVLNGKIYIMEYPVGYIAGFTETADRASYEPVIERSQLSINLRTGDLYKCEVDSSGNFSSDTVKISKDDPYLSYNGALSALDESKASFVIYGETGIKDGTEPAGARGGAWDLRYGDAYDKDNKEGIKVSVGRIVLRDYLEATYAPGVVAGDNLVVLGRKLRILQLAGSKENVVARFYDKEGNILGDDSAKLFIDDFADVDMLTASSPKSAYISKIQEDITTQVTTPVITIPISNKPGAGTSGGGIGGTGQGGTGGGKGSTGTVTLIESATLALYDTAAQTIELTMKNGVEPTALSVKTAVTTASVPVFIGYSVLSAEDKAAIINDVTNLLTDLYVNGAAPNRPGGSSGESSSGGSSSGGSTTPGDGDAGGGAVSNATIDTTTIDAIVNNYKEQLASAAASGVMEVKFPASGDVVSNSIASEFVDNALKRELDTFNTNLAANGSSVSNAEIKRVGDILTDKIIYMMPENYTDEAKVKISTYIQGLLKSRIINVEGRANTTARLFDIYDNLVPMAPTTTPTTTPTPAPAASSQPSSNPASSSKNNLSKIDKLDAEIINTVFCTTTFPGKLIGESDYSMTDEKPLFYAMAVKASMFNTGLFSGWVQSSDETQNSTLWWNNWLGAHGFQYKINSDNLVNYLKGNYAYELNKSGVIILDLETISKIQNEYKEQSQLETSRGIRTVFIVLGYALVAYSLILLVAWNMDVNVDLGINILEKLSFGKWVAIKDYEELPYLDTDDTHFVNFKDLLVSCIVIITVGIILILIDIIDLILMFIHLFGGIADYLSKIITGVR